MNKILLCNVCMNNNSHKVIYESNDPYFPVAETKVRYPVVAFYEKILKPEDKVKAILLVKEERRGFYKQNIEACRDELAELARKTGAAIDTEIILTPFNEDMQTHSDLLLQIIEKTDYESEITVDMTYGPKDGVIILFTALNFLEKFYGCEIANIIYGKAEDFVNGKPQHTLICEMAPLFYVSKLMNEVKSKDPDMALKMLKILLDK